MGDPRGPVGPRGRGLPTDPTGQVGDSADLDRRDEQILDEGEETFSLHEEQLIAHKEMRYLGDVEIRTVVDEVPGRIEVDLAREEVDVQHIPVGEYVEERRPPWEEQGVLTIPVYEEQLVVVKRLMLREYLKVRRIATTERRLFEEPLRRERLVIEDATNSGLVHERYPGDDDIPPGERSGDEARNEEETRADSGREGSFLERLGRRVLE
jgi:uncharacterized protein (TIGR02271 family)